MLARDWLNTYYLEDTGLFRVSLVTGGRDSALFDQEADIFHSRRTYAVQNLKNGTVTEAGLSPYVDLSCRTTADGFTDFKGQLVGHNQVTTKEDLPIAENRDDENIFSVCSPHLQGMPDLR